MERLSKKEDNTHELREQCGDVGVEMEEGIMEINGNGKIQ